MENIMNFLVSDVGTVIATVLQVAYILFLLLFMHFSAKHRNHKLSPGWYVAGVFFSPITALVFLSKRKKFPGANMKVCPICGDKYPEVYQVCGRCLIDLPENKEGEKKKEKSLSKVFGWLFVVIYVVTSIVTLAVATYTASYVIEKFGGMEGLLNDSYRMMCTDENGNKVFYDKKGNVYESGLDVPLYGEDGEVYTFVTTEEIDEYGEYKTVYVNEEGEEFISYLCYVTEDGFFYYDADDELVYPEVEYEEDFEEDVYDKEYPEDPDSIKAMIDLYFDEVIGFYSDYRYYDDYLVDEDGTKYYWSDEASWNEKGELITAENDPDPVTE